MLQQELCVHVRVYTATYLQRAVTLEKLQVSDIPDYPLWDLLTVPAFPPVSTHHIPQQPRAQAYFKTHIPHYFISSNNHGNGTEERWGS